MSQIFAVIPFTANVTQMGWQEVNYTQLDKYLHGETELIILPLFTTAGN